MDTFKFAVPVSAGSVLEANQALENRLAYDEDYGFPYQFGVIKMINDIAKEPIVKASTTVVKKQGGLTTKKAAILVLGTYYLAHKAQPYYKTWVFVHENPNDPRSAQIRSDWARARTSVRSAMNETVQSWKRHGSDIKVEPIVES